ncbi:hypothetical protein CVT25_009325 [Psilocybe cyanescens]|uniref:Cytochrome P450 n=1 Tax=Psilocybe cyanescens TaxID=93625 RepID=A0A409VNA7_PSICY|nr:hypothetical protein CVT25_009325 [Psilocybe cyanescens]
MPLSDLTVSLLLAVIPLSGVIFALYSNYQSWLKSPIRGLPYPPGPPLLLGSANQALKSQAWITYTEWSKKYGDIMYLNIYGEHTVILSNLDDTVELLERRSRVYSSRQKNPYIKLMGWDFNVGLIPYGDLWRRHRKLFQRFFRPKASVQYEPIQTAKIHNLLHDLLTTPSNFIQHCKKNASTMIMAILYGHDISDEMSTHFASLAENSVRELSSSIRPGGYAVSYIPILRHLPAWFPGAGFQRHAAEVRKLTTQMKDIPLDYVGKGLLHGTSSASLVSDLLENCYVQREYDVIKDFAATAFAAGADTTVSALESFFLAMSLFPEIQKKAQKEIDQVIGVTRLPTTADRPALPYVEAVYRELMRWAPVTPLNLEHTTTEDDIYKGFYIPKGTAVYANTWALTRNEEKYPNPELFNPDRFFTADGQLNNDDTVLTFGFGRRICPGRHLASTTVWLTIVSVLATFDLKGSKNKETVPISVVERLADGLIVHPLPFECDIIPRRGNVKTLIREAVGNRGSNGDAKA